MSGSGGVRAKIRRLPLKELAGGGGLVFLIASATLGLSNFVFHIVISRLLGPDQYGALGALLTVVLVLSVPLAAVQAAVTRAVALKAEEPIALRQMVTRATLAGVAGMVVLAGLSPVFAGFLHLGSPAPVLMLAAWLPPAAVGAVLQGVLVGRLRFTPFAVAMLVGGGAARLLFGVVLVEAGLGVTGAMLANTSAAIVTLGIVAWPLRREFHSSQRLSTRLLALGDGLAALLALGGFWVFASTDTFLVRHLMAPHPAGLYAAAVTGSRIALFAPAAFVTLVFPRFAATHGRGPEARRLLVLSMGVVVVIGFAVAGVILALPGPLVHILFGKGFSGSAGTIGILAVEAAVLGVIGLLVYFHLARGSLFAQLNWLGVGVAIAGIALFHRNLVDVAIVMLVTSLLVLVLSIAGAFLLDQTADRPKAEESDGDMSEPDAYGLSIVVPFFNPGPRFGPHLSDIVDVLATTGITFEVIAVSDGSTDGSQHVAADLSERNVRLITLPKNGGKGSALRIGITEARGTYVGFIDADGDLPAGLIPRLVELTRVDDQPDIVLGSKRHPDSEVVYPPLRHLYSMTYQALIALLFHLPVRDTQTGLKLIRRETLLAVIPRMVEKRFAFDLELLVVARHLGYRRFVEAPVVIRERFSSTISIRTVRGMFLDTLAIFYRLRILRFYDRVQPDASETGQATTTSDVLDATAGAAISPIGTPNAGLSSDNHTPETSLRRILIYNWRDLSHPHAGGAEVYTDAIATAWTEAGHRVTLFTSAVDGLREHETVSGGYQVIRRGDRHGVYRSARQFWEQEGRGHFDLVVDEVNTRPFGCPKWVTGVPVVALIHQVAREVWFHETWLPVAILGRFGLERHWLAPYRNTPTVTVSASSKQSLEKYGLCNVSVVPEGFIPQVGGPVSVPPPKESTLTFAFVGRLTGNKRPHDAIKAFGIVRKHLPDARLWVIGTGPMERRLRRRAPTGVEFLGRVSDEEKHSRLGRAHALLVTSVREGWGLVVTEAAAVGTPSFGYNVPGLRDSISVSGGILVDEHPKALASSLLDGFPTLIAGTHVAEPLGVISWPEVASSILAVAVGSSGPVAQAQPDSVSRQATRPGPRDGTRALSPPGSRVFTK
jgi:glycosyltransferase involved in cell wall biosynthesis/O-antigen/teichoic acid export membrane protein